MCTLWLRYTMLTAVKCMHTEQAFRYFLASCLLGNKFTFNVFTLTLTFKLTTSNFLLFLYRHYKQENMKINLIITAILYSKNRICYEHLRISQGLQAKMYLHFCTFSPTHTHTHLTA